MRQIPERLAMLLENPRILKAGRLVSSDLRQLQDTFKHPRSFVGALDLAKYAKDRHAIANAKCSLSDLCAIVLGKRLNKNVSERMSSAWERRKLTEDQCRYAACDAYVPLLLYTQLSQLSVPQKLLDPLLPNTAIILYNADSTTIIARGRLAAPDVHPTTYNNIKLTASQILVEILEVYVPGAIINSHKKRALQSFGSVPFQLISLRSRVRAYDPLTTQMPTLSGTHTSEQSMSGSVPTYLDLEFTDTDGGLVNEDPQDGAGSLMQETGESSSESSSSHLRSNDRDADSQTYGERILSSMSLTPWPTEIRSRILKDIFHVFNMLKLSPRHALRKDFAFTLRDAIFIPDKEDYARVSRYGSTLNPPQTFEQLRVRRPSWVWKHCKRVVPPPEELSSHVERVFSIYGPLKDASTQQPLFAKHNWDAAKKILELVRLGHISDPPGIPLYTMIGVNKRAGNLPIYRCFRGTNFTEGGVHTHLRSHLPTSGASIPHVNACLTDFVLHHNLKVSE